MLASNVTSLPEVAGDAALYADPFNIQDIQAGMEKLAGDDNLRKDLIAKARHHRTKFTWDRSAAGTPPEVPFSRM